MKKAVYSAIFNGKGTLNENIEKNEGWDYIVFTDDSTLKSSVWDVKVVRPLHKDPVRSYKLYKLRPDLCLKNYTRSIWVDASLKVKDISMFSNVDFSIGMMLHRVRNCVYDEARVCAQKGKDDLNVIKNHVLMLNYIQYPYGHGLTESCFVYRDHNKSKSFMKISHLLLSIGSKRDQLSLMPASWLSGVKVTFLNDAYNSLNDNVYFQLNDHRFYDPPDEVKAFYN